MPYKNKEDQKRSSRKHYEANKQLMKDRAILHNKKKRKDIKLFIVSFLTENHCVDCGESDPVVLDFDHVRGVKKYNVSEMVRNQCSLSEIALEISKCEVRCSNCHRRVTHKRRLEGKNIEKDNIKPIQLSLFL